MADRSREGRKALADGPGAHGSRQHSIIYASINRKLGSINEELIGS